MKTKLKYVTEIKVICEGRRIGTIEEVLDPLTGDLMSYRYFPKGSPYGGQRFATLAACKHSLEAE